MCGMKLKKRMTDAIIMAQRGEIQTIPLTARRIVTDDFDKDVSLVGTCQIPSLRYRKIIM